MTRRNIADIKIDGRDYSKYLILPFVLQDTGVEQLDSAIVELRGMPTDAKFAPFLPVSLFGGKYNYVVADDTVTEVFGRSLWNHQLTLIDETKMLERILMEGKSFTQPLKQEIGDPRDADVLYADGDRNEMVIGNAKTNLYKTPNKIEGESTVILQSPDAMAAIFDLVDVMTKPDFVEVLYRKGEISINDEPYETIYSKQLESDQQDSFKVYKEGVYTIKYHYKVREGTTPREDILSVPISFYKEADAPKKYSIYDVMNITLETAEPIFKGDSPRYGLSLTEEQEARFKAMDAPEMHFPNGRSLYENLKEIGDYIHALPRAKTDENGAKRIYWQELGSAERADLSKGVLYGGVGSYNAADYASAVEANFANLINSSDEAEGSVTDPYTDGFITLRSNSYRIKEEDSYIPTNFPIGTKISKVLVQIHNDDGTKDGLPIDITPAVFEKNEYDLLSSFSGIYPFSKTHALYYTTGQKNIEGLWYRVEDSALSIMNQFKNYAITNVINYFGDRHYDTTSNKLNYTNLSFQITYIPIINGRARQERTENTVERVILAHNQSANQLSAKAFGENLRGKVAMLGNSTDSKMYIFPSIDDIPKAGTMYDRKEFISLITTRVFPDFCLSRIDLSTNYNNQGAFVQMKTGIRQYEIPSGQDRCTLLEEFCIIGKDERIYEEDVKMLCRPEMKELTMMAFYYTNIEAKDITSAWVDTFDENEKEIATNIALPVYSTSLGASVYFGFSFEDNYSAGKRAADIGLSNARGTEYVEYGSPFYARAKYLDFAFVPSYAVLTGNTAIDVSNNLPSVGRNGVEIAKPTGDYISTSYRGALVFNKDSADIGNIAYQLHFVSNDGYIVTSEIARMMPYVRARGRYEDAPRVYFYDAEIEELTGEARGNVVAESDLDAGWEQSYFLRIKELPTEAYKSFVIKRPNGECIIGKNTDSADQTIHFNFKRRRT